MSTVRMQGAAIRRHELQNRGSDELPINVGASERWASLFGGGLLALYGISRGHASGLALTAIGAGLVYRGYTGHCGTYQLLGMTSTQHDGRVAIPSKLGIKVEESVTIAKPAEELYKFWRKLDNLPRVMRHVVSVTETGNRSHWVAKGPQGNVEWDAEIITDTPNALISWRSVEGSDVASAGSVAFKAAPGDRGTEVKVTLDYNPPGGRIGATVAWLMGRDPQTEIREDLHSFKRMMETGTAVMTAF